MSDLQTREQMLAGIVKPADILDLLGKVDHVQYKTGWQSKHLAADAIREITRLRTALSEAEQRARREALEEAAAIIEANMLCGADSEVLLPRSNPGNKVGFAYAAAIRALIPSEPHDAEGRE